MRDISSTNIEDSPGGFERLPLQWIVPSVVLLIAILQFLYYWFGMPPSSEVDYIDFLRKFLMVVIGFALVVYIQRLRDDKLGYILLVVGFSFFVFSQLENSIDVFRSISYPIAGVDLEDFVAIALLIAGVGLWRWARFLVVTKELTAMHQRETELYAALLRHDLSNDLQALIGYVEAASMTSEEIPPRAADLLKSAGVAGTRMSRLVKAFAAPLKRTDEDVVSLVRRICSEAEIAHRGIRITIQADQEIGKLMPHGASLVTAALENLIRNTHEHGGANPEMNVRISPEDGHAVLLVSDNGPGIPEEIKRTVFDRGISDTDKGLGLYLTRRLIEGLGGSIEQVDDTEYGGASFRIVLPLAS